MTDCGWPTPCCKRPTPSEQARRERHHGDGVSDGADRRGRARPRRPAATYGPSRTSARIAIDRCQVGASRDISIQQAKASQRWTFMTAVDRKLSILITGAASGIGLGMSRHLARHGHRVMASDIHENEVSAAVAELQSEGFAVRAMGLDVTSSAAIERALEEMSNDGPDVLINNAGLQHVAALEEFPPE